MIITDIDSGYTEETQGKDPPKQKHHNCTPNDKKAKLTTNDSLAHFHGKERTDLAYFVALTSNQKCLKKNDGAWQQADDGYVYLAYQTEENGYHARSFEDAFFSLNQELLRTKGHDAFQSLTNKWFNSYLEDNDHFQFAEKGVGSKPSLAIEILMNSEPDGEQEFSNWSIPSYIKEGLVWLRKD